MISVDAERCGYCGACVSICPVDALDLQETRLVVKSQCIDCNLCLSACPTGALVAAGDRPPPLEKVRDNYDLVVVGAGPGGSVAAREAAARGLSVLLLEKRQEIGSPVRCAEGIAPRALNGLIEADSGWVSARVRRARITIVRDGRDMPWEPEAGLETQQAAEAGYILERRVFDRVLAEKAAEAGARVLVKTAAVALICEDGRVVGVQARGPSGERSIAARVVIGADGVESRVGTWAGLNTSLPPSDLMTCAQFLLAGIDIDPECTYYYLDQECAPGGYVWIFPKGRGRANVGLGVQADLAKRSPVELLTRFVEQRAFLAQGSVVTMIVGGVPVGVPRGPIATDGCLLVGDAARQVDPLTGGGIANAMTAGRLAASVVCEAIAAGDVTGHRLHGYEEEWRANTGLRLERHYRLRSRFGLEQRLSERFLHVFAVSIGAGL